MSIQEQSKAVIHDRMTMVMVISHEHRVSRNPIFQLDYRYERKLKTFERVYGNEFTIGEEWKSIKTGWIDKIGLIILSNEEGRGLSREALQNYGEILEGLILEVKYKDAPDKHCFKILPGEALPFLPESPDDLVVRAATGEIKYTLTIIPG